MTFSDWHQTVQDLTYTGIILSSADKIYTKKVYQNDIKHLQFLQTSLISSLINLLF